MINEAKTCNFVRTEKRKLKGVAYSTTEEYDGKPDKEKGKIEPA